MKITTNIYNNHGCNYATYEEASRRVAKLKQDHFHRMAESSLAGHKFPQKTWRIMGTYECGFYIIETVE